MRAAGRCGGVGGWRAVRDAVRASRVREVRRFHPGILSGSFNIPRFPLNGGGQESEPPTVYADLYTGSLYLDKPNEIDRYSGAFAGIWQHALDEEASRELIQQAAEALTNG